MAKARSSKAQTKKQSKKTTKTGGSTAARKTSAKKAAAKSTSAAAKTGKKAGKSTGGAAKKSKKAHAAPKKASTKKASTKKKSTKKASTRKAASTKKTAVKKAGAKKSGSNSAAAKKTSAKKASAKKSGTNNRPTRRAKTPMDRKQLAHFRELLLEKRAELVGDLSEMENSALRYDQSNLSTMPQHMADMGSDSYDQDLTLGLMESERELLAEIDEALERIEQGTFGVCVETGKPINKARLEVKPWAKYCIEAARQHEGRRHG